MNKLKFKSYYKRTLPHFQMNDGIYAITFRLAFSLPKGIVVKMKSEKKQYDEEVKKLNGEKLKSYRHEFDKKYYDDFDNFIGKYNMSYDWLKQKECGEIIFDSILHWDEKRYKLYCFCIMSNHVHLLIKPLYDSDEICYSLSKILFSIKRYTAGKCNKVLGKKGQFWQHESYDHRIRNENDFYYQMNYILQNPVKAKLIKNWEDWPFVYLNQKNWQT